MTKPKSLQPTTDSQLNAAARRAMIREEATKQAEARTEQEAHRAAVDERQAKAAREDELKYLEGQGNLLGNIDTRDALLERIRQMRAEAKEPPKPIGRQTQQEIDQYNAEVEAGRAAVAKAEAYNEYAREARRQMELEDALKRHQMREIRHPNPNFDEAFPVYKPSFK